MLGLTGDGAARAASSTRRARAVAASLLALLALAGCEEPRPEGEPRPNVVLVIGDDQGWADYGFMGSPRVRTPRLDALAAEGVVFPLGYTTSSVCTPSLRTLLTGLHPAQFDARRERLRAEHPDLDDVFAIRHFDTLPRMLGRAGYASFQAGKHWEGDYRAAGFDDGMTEAYDPVVRWGGRGVALGRETMEPVEAFLDAHGDEPFFLWFAPMLPHIPHDAPEAFLALYPEGSASPSARRYYASCTWFDDVVGRLVDGLEARGLLERTLLIHLADNGWDQPPGRNLRGRVEKFLGGPRGKASLYDDGFRTPILLRGPGVAAGRRVDALVSIVDVVPTILDYAAVEAPPGLPGRSLRPLVEGRAAARDAAVVGSMAVARNESAAGPDDPLTLPEEAFFVRTRERHFILRADRGSAELYDVVADPGERRDLAAERPDEVARFRAEIARWRAEVRGETTATPAP